MDFISFQQIDSEQIYNFQKDFVNYCREDSKRIRNEDSHNETMEPIQEQKTSENISQIVYSATIEKQIYLPEEENLSTNVPDAEELYIFLNGLSYRNETCDGLPEYSIHFDDGSQYYVNITDGWIWRGNNEEARLTGDEMELFNIFIQ